MLLVLHFRFGQSRFLYGGPHHRLHAAIEHAVFHEFMDLPHDLAFGFLGHGQVGVVPRPSHAQALELRALRVHPIAGKAATFFAEIQSRHIVFVLALFAVFLLNLPLNRQAMTIPARHVGHVIAHHLPAADNHIFQDLIQRVSHMDVAIRIRRAIMQDPFGLALRFLPDLRIEIHIQPALRDLRLLLRQTAAHREIGGG